MGSHPGDRNEDEALRARLDRLSGALKGRAAPPPAQAPPPTASSKPGDSGMSLAMRAGSEFISAVLVGAALGWGVDRLFHTNPAFLIVFFFLGVAAGVWNVVRVTSPKSGPQSGDSPLSRADPPDKDGRRPASQGRRDASLGGRGASGGAATPGDGADDDED